MAAKRTTKAAAAKETKVEEVATAETVAEVKEEVKAEAKKPAAKKTAKAKEPKVNVIVEYLDKNTPVNDLVELVKEAYKADGNTDTIETIDVYFQPEKNVAYYVVNGKPENKSVDL